MKGEFQMTGPVDPHFKILADAIYDAGVKAGVVAPGASPNGPDLLIILDALAARQREPAVLPGCPGIPASGCNYFAPCNGFCNKCGKTHHSHLLAASPAPPEQTSGTPGDKT